MMPQERPVMTLMSAGALGAATAAAREHGLLLALAEGPASPEDLAARLSLDPWATRVVLEVLAAHGLVEPSPDGLRLTPPVHAELRGPAGHPTHDTQLWAFTPHFLKDGRTVAPPDAATRDRIYKDVVPRLAALFEAPAALLCDALADRIPFGARVLDVGAGSGVWSLSLARRRPDVRVTGLDLPGTAERFLERAAALGVAERTAAIRGDYLTVEHAPCAFDVALFAHVLHLEPPDRAAALLRRHVAALAPGGIAVIVDALPAQDRAGSFLSAYGLHLALRLPGARPHAHDDLRGWLRDAGLPAAQHVVLDDAGLIGAILATA
jgi:SAM-dependent methyltransferase